MFKINKLLIFILLFSTIILSSCNFQDNQNGVPNNNTWTTQTWTTDDNWTGSTSTWALWYSWTDNTWLGLEVSDNFTISIFADNLPWARDIIWPDALWNFWLSRTREWIITLLWITSIGVVNKNDILTWLNNPHWLALSPDWLTLYFAETDKISKIPLYTEWTPEKLVDLPEWWRHFTRSLIFWPDEKLYVSIWSTCDVCYEQDERIASIYRLDTDWTNFEQVATGLRNAVFMTTNPITWDIWVTEMWRDNLWDDLPPDEINIIEEWNDYGWPICYGDNVHDSEFDTNTYKTDPCMDKTPAHIELQAHSAPLWLAFVPEEWWPENYWHDLLVAYHGSWNRSVPTWYKIMHIRLDDQWNVQGRRDFIRWWLGEDEDIVGRPVDIFLMPGWTWYITDDRKWVVYKLTYNNPEFIYIDQLSFSDEENNIRADIEINQNQVIFINWEATWTWYFEANFGIEVVDENDNTLADTYVSTSWEWMTENYVPFHARFNYEDPETDYWYIVFRKANPSWLPENEFEKRVRVQLRQ